MTRLLLLLAAALGLCYADPQTPAWDPNAIVTNTANSFSTPASAPPAILCDALPKPAQDDCHAALRAEFHYHVSQWNHRAATFEWQLFSSQLLFWLVSLIVLAGVTLTIFQFRHIFARRSRKTDPPVSSVELSPDKVSVSSSVVGVVILTLSLGFYFLYLVLVYPIRTLPN